MIRKSNLEYFNNIGNSSTKIINYDNPRGNLVIKSSPSQKDSNLSKYNKKLINILISYNTLIDLNSGIETPKATKLLEKLIEIIETVKNINYTPFCVYFQVLKFSYCEYKQIMGKLTHEEKLNLFREITMKYLENRHQAYMLHGYSDIVLQVCSDLASNRRKSKEGINNVIKLLSSKYTKANDIENFLNSNFSYFLPDKGDKNIFHSLLSKLQIKFIFMRKRQKKYPDLVLKINDEIFIIKHKLTNNGGGAQNSEINEIIDFISHQEKNKNVHYVSCLEGSFSRMLFSEKISPKSLEQKNAIIKSLKKYSQNYFINEFELKNLIENYEKEINK